jgi:predicted membrane-bound spermidine synthase
LSEHGWKRVFLGVSIVSLCVLVLQLTLTRLFSATMYYHFAFLAISLALFGSGASGVAVYLLARRLSGLTSARVLSAAAALFAVTTVVALLVILANPLSPRDDGGTTVRRLVAIYAATALPFFFAGAAITIAISRYAGEISRLYLFDLAGAAAGCLLLVPLLDTFGAVNTVLLAAAGAAGASLLFESAQPSRRGWRAGLAALAGLLLALTAVNAGAGFLDVRRAKGLTEAGNVIFARWNSFSRVTVWGSLENDTVLIMIDADAATPLSRDGHDLARHAHQRNRVEALAYWLKPQAKALVIGPGGGDDVIMARLFGAKDVTAVEVNAIIARDVVSSEPFRRYSGALFEQPGVRLVVDEARSFIRSSRERYDVVQGTMVDTWAATAAGAFALTENNLYTVEAFRDYADHLSDDGVVSLTRWYAEPPDQLLRLVTVTRAMMRERGIDDAAERIAIVRGPTERGSTRAPTTFLFKLSPFTDRELRLLDAVAAANRFTVLYSPRHRAPGLFTRLIEATDPRSVWETLESDVSPTRDNDPFFFNTVRLRNVLAAVRTPGEWSKTNLGTFVLLVLVILTAVVSVLFIVGPLAIARGGALAGRTGPKLAYLLYFACLGAGFIVVEVVLVQKCILFLGHPVYALSVVLFALLAFSGIGSALSGRIPAERLSGALPIVLAAVVVCVLLAVVVLAPVFYALVHLDRLWRILVTVAALAPLGLVMGMPMPTAIRILARDAPEILPWAWGVNGATSVMGSVAALAIAILTGFDAALLVGAALYVAALALAAGPIRNRIDALSSSAITESDAQAEAALVGAEGRPPGA